MADTKADLVLCNARAVTLDPRYPDALTIYIRGDHILKVSNLDFDRSLTSPRALVIDCAGKTVIPGFHDAHCHVVGYAESLVNVDVSPSSVHSIDDMVQKIKRAASMAPAGSWIRCTGYNEFYLSETRPPTRHDLDRATIAYPVKLMHRSGHAYVLNTPAMAIAGITNELEEPPGGMIDRDLDTGEPNGLLFGMGRYLANVVPPLSDNELDMAIKYAGKALVSLGVTSVQDASPGNDLNRWRQFLDWKKRGLFAPRTMLMFGPEQVEILPLHDKRSGLRSGAVKIVLDEVRGCLNPPQAELNKMIAAIHDRHLQVAIHAVEETTIDAAIKALIFALEKYPLHGHRHRIEHCSICTADNAGKLAKLGAVIVTNPSFIYYSGERYLATVHASQRKHLYALNTMLQAGLRIAAGSDAPVVPPDPLKGIYSAIARKAETGQVVLKKEAVSFIDALSFYTGNAAYSCFQERQLGTITRGKYADLVILNMDSGNASQDEIADTKVDMTILGGKVVYRRTSTG
ncbi:MAG: amidohydrolase [Chloroflexi bacterium]|nr:amidohydrolase [Chloroflexota bacterium]